MAKFTYSKKEWDKARPTLMKSTGLGEALKNYEGIKDKLKSNGLLDFYSDAIQAFGKVEIARQGAIKEAGTKHADAKKFLESADPTAEKGFLAALIANHLINGIGKAEADLKRVTDRVENRLKVFQTALPLYKDPEKAKTVHPKLAAACQQMLHEDGDNKTVKLSPSVAECAEAINPKYQLKKNPALKGVLDKCETIVDQVKNFRETQAQVERLARELLPLVPKKGG